MKKLLVIFLGTWISITGTSAQVVKKTMVEHFTNTKCSICAMRNPGFQNNLDQHPQVNHISIHPSAPYATCYLSLQNTSVNDARTNYYGIYGGTPRLVINGSVINSGANYADTSIFLPFVGLTPISISIEQQAAGPDSIRSVMVLKRESNEAPFGMASLFAGLVEDTVVGNGGNGELEHYNVLRASLFSTSGLSVTLPVLVGDSLVITQTTAYQNFWNSQRIRTVCILQETINHSLIQSELSSVAKTGDLTGIHSLEHPTEKWKAFPNPADQILYVENTTNSQVGSFYLVNSLGQKLIQATGQNAQLNVSELPAGLYFLVDHDSNQIGKIIVQHP
jgi:hypothetical protein